MDCFLVILRFYMILRCELWLSQPAWMLSAIVADDLTLKCEVQSVKTKVWIELEQKCHLAHVFFTPP